MAALLKLQGMEKSLTNINVIQFATMKSAFDGCSQEIQNVISEMVQILTDETVSEEDKSHAVDVIAEAMFPSLTADIREHDEFRNASNEAKEEEKTLLDEENVFGERLRGFMADKNISQEKLAAETGVSQPAISNMLNRKCRPQRRTIARFAVALGVEPTELWPLY